MAKIRRCVLCGCRTYSNVSLMKFPRDETVAAQWARFCNVSLSHLNNDTRLCSQHFTPECFKSAQQDGKRRALKPDATPSLLLGIGEKYRRIKGRLPFRIFCSICGSIESTVKMRSYRFPKDANVRSQWLQSLGMKESDVKESSRMCCRHFTLGDKNNVPVRDLIYKEVSCALSVDDHNRDTTTLRLLKTPKDEIMLLMPEDSVLPTDFLSLETCSRKNPLNSEGPLKSPNDEIVLIMPEDSFLPKDFGCWEETLNPEIPRDLEGGPSKILNYDVVPEESDTRPAARLAVADTSSQKYVFEGPRNVDVSSDLPTTPKSSKPSRAFRYLHDFSTPDLETPRRKRRCLQLAKSQVEKYRSQINRLYQENRRFRSKIAKLQEGLATFQKKGLVSDEAAEALKALMK